MGTSDDSRVHDITPAPLRDIRDEIRAMRSEMRAGFEHQRLLLSTTLEGHEHAQHARLASEIAEIKRRLEALERRPGP